MDPPYDFFIIHAEADEAWVEQQLRAPLGLPAERVLSPRAFVPGASILSELQRGVAQSRVTLLVLSGAFLQDGWSHFGGLLALGGMAERQRFGALIPVYREECQVNLPVTPLVALRFRDGAAWGDELERLRKLLLAPAPGGVGSGAEDQPELIDFSDERRRHGAFLGREALLAELSQRCTAAAATGGWVLLQGGPGLGKSALLSGWLGSLEAPRWPHHFIRRGVEDWDRPGRIAAALAAQVEARFPAQRDRSAEPATRLPALLRRVSREVLVSAAQELVLVVDGLDEASGDGAHNPLPRFLPALLPPRVVVLCASRPDYPRLEWLLAQRPLSIIDLDQEGPHNEQACAAFWAHHGPRLVPPLLPGVAEEAARRAQARATWPSLIADPVRVALQLQMARTVQTPKLGAEPARRGLEETRRTTPGRGPAALGLGG